MLKLCHFIPFKISCHEACFIIGSFQIGQLKHMGTEYSLDKEVVVHIHNGILLSHKKEHI